MTDEIIKELWRIKDDIAREHSYDLDRLVADLRNTEQAETQRRLERCSNRQKPRDLADTV